MSWPTLTALALTVRLYDGTALPEPTLARAVDTAVETLRDAGIVSTWLACSASIDVDGCRQPLAGDSVVLRIRDASLGGTQEVLGDAVVDLGMGAGYFATVYANRVARVAAGARVETGTLLGRALAHEVGHLLLGHQRHSGRGLMRANWTTADMRRQDPTIWRFTDEERTLLQRQLARRAARAQPAGELAAAAVRPFSGPLREVSPGRTGASAEPAGTETPAGRPIRPGSPPGGAGRGAPPTTPPPGRASPTGTARAAAAG